MNNPFRGEVPPLSAPDRAEWQRDHGRPPVKLDVCGAHLDHARRLVDRDLTALTKEQAFEAHNYMEELCERVLAKSNLDWDAFVCFFDSDTNAFWAYPI